VVVVLLLLLFSIFVMPTPSSGMNKPNKQTLVVPVVAMELLRTLPLQDLNGFGWVRARCATTLPHGFVLAGCRMCIRCVATLADEAS
jgi:hypothetical protein